jgi:hypothetical protein
VRSERKILVFRFSIEYHRVPVIALGGWATIKEAVEPNRVKGVCFLVKTR